MAWFNSRQPHFPDLCHRPSPSREWSERWCITWVIHHGIAAMLVCPSWWTPYLDPKTCKEELLNKAHKVTVCIIERAFGVLKRFHVLHSEVRMAPDRVCTIVVACCILHNIAVILGEPDPEDCDMEDEGCAADLHSQYHGHETGNGVRQHTFF